MKEVRLFSFFMSFPLKFRRNVLLAIRAFSDDSEVGIIFKKSVCLKSESLSSKPILDSKNNARNRTVVYKRLLSFLN